MTPDELKQADAEVRKIWPEANFAFGHGGMFTWYGGSPFRNEFYKVEFDPSKHPTLRWEVELFHRYELGATLDEAVRKHLASYMPLVDYIRPKNATKQPDLFHESTEE